MSSTPTAMAPVRQALPPRPNPPAPVFATTSSATANAALSSLDATIAPFREAPPAEEGAAGIVAAGVGGALGVINAPAMFVDHAVSAGISAGLDALGLTAMFPPFPIARMGITMHMGTPHTHIHPPSTTPPAPPIPLPSFGVAFLSGSASVLVNGIPALRAGDVGIGFTCGSLAPPFEIVTGASSVYFAGSRVARIGIDMTMHCNPAKPMGAFGKAMGIAGAVAGAAGAAAQLSAGNPAAALVQGIQAGLDAAAFALALLRGKDPAGPPGLGMLIGPPPNVQAGGPPIPNIGAWAQGHLFKAIGKAARSLKDKARRRSPAADANAPRCQELEPVHVVTGENYNIHVDFKAFHGAFSWKRYTTSARAHESGPVGYGFFHVFQARLNVRLHRVTYLGFQGERIEFPRFLPNQSEMVSNGYRLTRLSDTHFLLEERRLGKMEFRRPSTLVNEAMPIAVESKTARATLVYNTAGQLEQIREVSHDGTSASAQYQLYYDRDGRLIEVQGCNLASSDGAQPKWVRLVSYAYDAAGDLRVAEDALGLQERYQYDRLHRLIEATDRRDYAFTWQYDLEGRCIGGGGQDGAWRAKLAYFPEERKTEVTLHDGSMRVVHYDEDGVITKIIDPCGGELTRERGENGSITAEVDAGGRRFDCLYDSQGAHFGRLDRFGNMYPPLLEAPKVGSPLARTLPETPIERALGTIPEELGEGGGLDALFARVPTQLRSVLRSVFDQPERPVAPPRCERDTYGRVLRETHADGSCEEWSYDGVGNWVMHLDRDGRLHQRRIASWNLVGERIDPLGNITRYTYNPHEHVTSITDPLGNESRYDYDSKDRVVRVHRNGRVREEYSYDAGDRLVEKRDHAGQPLLRLKPHQNGLIQSIELARGGTIELDYDARACTTKASTDRHEVLQEWDSLRRLLRACCDQRSIEHAYTTRGRSSTIIAKHFEIRYLRDISYHTDSHRIRGMQIVAPNGFTWTIAQGAEGVVQLQHGGTSSTTHELQQYSRKGKLTARAVYQTQNTGSDNPLAAWCSYYRYSVEGDLLEIRDTQRGLRKFEVDAAHRLVAELGFDGHRVEYPLDEAGNLLSKPGLVLAKLTTGNRLLHADVETFSYDERDHIAERVRGIEHPDAPRVRYEHDSFDQLIAVHDGRGEPWTATYDGLGRRVSSGRGEEQTLFWWDDDRLAAETSPTGAFRVYIYAHERALVPIGFVDYASVDAAPESGLAYSVYSDQVGLPLCISDSRGAVVWWAERVDPYGAVHVRPGALVEYNLRWPGHYFDSATGLHYNRYRYYDPRLGRYLESDPLGCAGGVNLYAYTPNPLVSVDVLGLHNEDKHPVDEDGRPTHENPDAETAPPPKFRAEVDGQPVNQRTGLTRDQEQHFRQRIDAAEAAGDRQAANDARFDRNCQARANREPPLPPLSRADWDASNARMRENSDRGRVHEQSALDDLGVQNNNRDTDANGNPREVATYPHESGDGTQTRPDGVTDTSVVDVKSVPPGRDSDGNPRTVYQTDQLRSQREGAAGDDKQHVTVISSDGPADDTRPSRNLGDPRRGGSDAVLHRDNTNGQMSQWDPNTESWSPISNDDARSIVGGT